MVVTTHELAGNQEGSTLQEQVRTQWPGAFEGDLWDFFTKLDDKQYNLLLLAPSRQHAKKTVQNWMNDKTNAITAMGNKNYAQQAKDYVKGLKAESDLKQRMRNTSIHEIEELIDEKKTEMWRLLDGYKNSPYYQAKRDEFYELFIQCVKDGAMREYLILEQRVKKLPYTLTELRYEKVQDVNEPERKRWVNDSFNCDESRKEMSDAEDELTRQVKRLKARIKSYWRSYCECCFSEKTQTKAQADWQRAFLEEDVQYLLEYIIEACNDVEVGHYIMRGGEPMLTKSFADTYLGALEKEREVQQASKKAKTAM